MGYLGVRNLEELQKKLYLFGSLIQEKQKIIFTIYNTLKFYPIL